MMNRDWKRISCFGLRIADIGKPETGVRLTESRIQYAVWMDILTDRIFGYRILYFGFQKKEGIRGEGDIRNPIHFLN